MSDDRRPTHLTERGEVHMVDVGEKAVTARKAVARARVTMAPETVTAVRSGAAGKGDVEATVRIAAIMATKETPRLIPLCHPIVLTKVAVDLVWEGDGATITVTTECRERTGVEMEAMVGASVGALALYDMVKGLERGVSIGAVELVEKTGGRSGHWVREGAR